jgi:myo-inositol-1(or 4)-monophosphatase
MNSISPNLNIMIKAAEKASKILIRDFGELENLQVSKKGPRDFVTNSDKKAEKIIIEELLKSKKRFSVLSEETGEIKNNDLENTWLIDPIDGTLNFLHGLPHFAISIAHRCNDEILSGLIFDPIKNEMFYAEKNNGAFFNNQRMRVSNKKAIDECLFASNEKNNNTSSLSVRNLGSAALDMAYVGSGRFDGFFQKNLNLWDIAAGIIIVKEAGGVTNEIDLLSNSKIDIMAGSNAIYENMVKNLNNF